MQTGAEISNSHVSKIFVIATALLALGIMILALVDLMVIVDPVVKRVIGLSSLMLAVFYGYLFMTAEKRFGILEFIACISCSMSAFFNLT